MDAATRGPSLSLTHYNPASTRGQLGPGVGSLGQGRRLAWLGPRSFLYKMEPMVPAPQGSSKGL